ncbi:Regulator of RpoS [subsurface metagenome]
MERQIIPDEGKATGGEKMKPILIVEDEVVVRESLRDWLTDSGYQVETAKEGEEALKAIAQQDFSIALLDLKLPGKDGIEVLREAREKSPALKGIIITAYPSLESAVEAVKVGAVDYLPKPLDLNQLEKLIRDILGPVQVEIRPEAIPEEAVAEPTIVEKAKVEEVIDIAPEEIPVRLKQGKAQFEAGRYQEALGEFEAIFKAAPGNIEARVWLRKTREALVAPEVEGVDEEARPKYCIWMSLGMVSHRICTNDYNCMNCEFDQEIQEKMASGETPELEEALARFKELPGSQKLCRYAFKGDVSYRLCTRVFQCATCEFGQMMDDAMQQVLAQRVDELAARQEALHKKEQSWWWPYWEPEVPVSSAKSFSSN